MPGISQRMLTLDLRALEKAGIVQRTIYPEIPPRVEYDLTAEGKRLRELVDLLGEVGARLASVERCSPLQKRWRGANWDLAQRPDAVHERHTRSVDVAGRAIAVHQAGAMAVTSTGPRPAGSAPCRNRGSSCRGTARRSRRRRRRRGAEIAAGSRSRSSGGPISPASSGALQGREVRIETAVEVDHQRAYADRPPASRCARATRTGRSASRRTSPARWRPPARSGPHACRSACRSAPRRCSCRSMTVGDPFRPHAPVSSSKPDIVASDLGDRRERRVADAAAGITLIWPIRLAVEKTECA